MLEMMGGGPGGALDASVNAISERYDASDSNKTRDEKSPSDR